jgi:hypothetical protein
VASLAAAELAGDFQTAHASNKIEELTDVSLAEEKYPSVVDDINSQYWITIPVSGTDTTFVLDFKRGKDYRWTSWEGLVVGGYYKQVIDSDGEKQVLIAGDRTLYRKKRDDDTEPYSDAGSAYAKHFRSKEFDMEIPYNRKEIDRYGVSIEKKTANVEVVTKLYYDGDVSTAAMTNTWDLDASDTGRDLVLHRKVWGSAGRRFRTLQLDLTNSAIEGFCINNWLVDILSLTHRRTSEV